ncbi:MULTISPECIES: DMT family transporter [Roseobacteraceae]|jgi:drug/metabolite transporter (DMT)-like permease|uniref:Putative DMT superfamily transporter inner membrane protein n=1 Tax=Pseudosulfitobacter pseudonitzschiae TaxID=1402135 RepID=A0A221K4M9_9RHOB|nr:MULTISPECIES: DMT family transporter [Roseobacteraceae]ASM73823.1 putative DMT superfamily transporter inner membrane protein [Pseudosulfitobacter pseudonitzschiae]
MDIKAILMGVFFALIWSSAFSSARIIVADASPLASLSLRFFLSGIIGVIIARMMGQTWNLTRDQWRATLVFGLCQNAIYLGLNFFAMQTVQASLASIIASTMPLMVAAAGWIVFRDRLPLFGVIGLLLGIVGVVIIMSARMDAGVDLRGVALCVIAAVSLTVATLSMRGASSGGNLMMVVGLQMLVGSGVLAVVSALTETIHVNLTPELVAAFVYTMLAPGLLATYIWFALVQRIGAVKAATFHFLNPFFGVAIAAYLLGEQLGAHDILGVVVIGLGILAVQLSRAVKT